MNQPPKWQTRACQSLDPGLAHGFTQKIVTFMNLTKGSQFETLSL